MLFLMKLPPTNSNRTDTLFPHTTLFRSVGGAAGLQPVRPHQPAHQGLDGPCRPDHQGAGHVRASGAGGRGGEAPPGDRPGTAGGHRRTRRSEEHTSELQSLMRISYAVFCLKNNKLNKTNNTTARPT